MKLSLNTAAIALLSLSTVAACSKAEPAPTEKKAAATVPAKAEAAPSKFKVGDKVDVDWNGSWYKASIVSVNGGKYKVHYEGWDAKWDEEVAEAKIRTPAAITYSYKVDDLVEVQWKSKWYKSKVLSDEGSGKYKIHYEGWDAKWDEVVPANRIRKMQK